MTLLVSVLGIIQIVLIVVMVKMYRWIEKITDHEMMKIAERLQQALSFLRHEERLRKLEDNEVEIEDKISSKYQ